MAEDKSQEVDMDEAEKAFAEKLNAFNEKIQKVGEPVSLDEIKELQQLVSNKADLIKTEESRKAFAQKMKEMSSKDSEEAVEDVKSVEENPDQ